MIIINVNLFVSDQVKVNLDALVNFEALSIPDQITRKVFARKSGSLGLTFEVTLNLVKLFTMLFGFFLDGGHGVVR